MFAIEAGSLSTGSMKMSYVGVCLVQPGLFCTGGARGFACPHQGFSHRLRVDGTGVFNLTASNTKTVQQPCELTVSLTQLIAFLNCRTLSS